MTRPLVVYHAGCWDGFTAAWVAARALGGADLYPAHYGQPPPDVRGRVVFVVDFSYPRDVLLRMALEATSIRVIDHHATARDALADLDFCTFDMQESGASLTWRHFYGNQPLPPIVAYVRDRDLWRHELHATREINAYLRTFDFDLGQWDALDTLLWEPSGVIIAGAAIRRAEAKSVALQTRGARDVTIAGQPFRVVNATHMLSEVAGELARTTGAGAVWFVRSDGRVQWSLRTNGTGDVSPIAKRYGGGGHPGASGFGVSMVRHRANLAGAGA